MKTKLIILFVFVLTSYLFSQIAFNTHYVKKHAANRTTTQMDTLNFLTTFGARLTGGTSVQHGLKADTTWYLTSTGKDTSRVYRLKSGSITFHPVLDDTSTADDSAGVRMKIYVAPRRQFDTGIPAFSTFVLADSTDFEASSGVDGQGAYKWVYTSAGSNRAGFDFFYVTLEGITSVNKVLSAVSVLLSITFAF